MIRLLTATGAPRPSLFYCLVWARPFLLSLYFFSFLPLLFLLADMPSEPNVAPKASFGEHEKERPGYVACNIRNVATTALARKLGRGG